MHMRELYPDVITEDLDYEYKSILNHLLSKEDAEDNLMRVCSKEIAAELLEMTFGSEVEMQEW